MEVELFDRERLGIELEVLGSELFHEIDCILQKWVVLLLRIPVELVTELIPVLSEPLFPDTVLVNEKLEPI